MLEGLEISEVLLSKIPIENNVFRIEQSNIYKNLGKGIKTVEFILLKNEKKLLFIEAKSSSPRPSKESNERFDVFLSEISDKFIHSFNLYLSAVLGRYNNHEVHSSFMEINNSSIEYIFILVIRGHKVEWLKPLEEALYKKTQHHNKIWKSRVVLMNEEIAKTYKLIKGVVD